MKMLRKVPTGLQSVNDKGETMKLCEECKQWKKSTLFSNRFRKRCKSCMNKWLG